MGDFIMISKNFIEIFKNSMMMKVYISQKYKQRWQHKTHQIIRLNKSTMGDRGLIQIIGLCDIVKASNNKQLSEITEQ